MFKLIADRAPDDERDPACQAALSRFENAIAVRSFFRRRDVFLEPFMASFDEPPRQITLDLDAFDDPTHGAGLRQLTARHAPGAHTFGCLSKCSEACYNPRDRRRSCADCVDQRVPCHRRAITQIIEARDVRSPRTCDPPHSHTDGPRSERHLPACPCCHGGTDRGPFGPVLPEDHE
ncbi:MAG: transposase [Planctomycetaceae bacterium]